MAAPIKNTCPNINKTIKRLETIKGHMKDMVSWVERELDDIEYDLEELRSGNATLRDWGESCEAKIDKLEQQIYELENK